MIRKNCSRRYHFFYSDDEKDFRDFFAKKKHRIARYLYIFLSEWKQKQHGGSTNVTSSKQLNNSRIDKRITNEEYKMERKKTGTNRWLIPENWMEITRKWNYSLWTFRHHNWNTQERLFACKAVKWTKNTEDLQVLVRRPEGANIKTSRFH